MAALMKHPAVWVLSLVLGSALLTAAVVRGQGAPMLRLPEDLNVCPAAEVSGVGDSPLFDGTSRKVRGWLDGFYPALTRGDERVSLPLAGVGTTLLGAAHGAVTLLKTTLPAAPPSHTLSLMRVGIAENETPRQQIAVPIPEEILTVDDMMLSPDGRSIAWSVTTRREKPGVHWLRRHFPAVVRTGGVEPPLARV